MDDGTPAAAHEERRLLDDIVSDIDDAIGVFDGAMHEIAIRQRGIAQPQRMRFIQHALAHLGGEEGDAEALDELAQHLAAGLAIGTRTHHENGLPGFANCLHRTLDGLVVGNGAPVKTGLQHDGIGLVVGDVFRKFEVGGAGAFFLGATEGFANAGGNVVGRNDLSGELGQRLHHVDDIDDLEMPLFGNLDRLLPGDHQHRHAAQLRVRG